MTPQQAIESLRGRPTVTVVKAPIRAIKDLHSQCLAAGIPAAMIRPCKDNGG
jgi:hypothetical protein